MWEFLITNDHTTIWYITEFTEFYIYKHRNEYCRVDGITGQYAVTVASILSTAHGPALIPILYAAFTFITSNSDIIYVWYTIIKIHRKVI
jgi:hypothetical protein